MILVVDRNGNTIPAAAMQFAGGVHHAGPHAFRVSQAGMLATEVAERSVTRDITLTRDATVTREAATRVLTLTRERDVWDSTHELTRVGTREISRPLTAPVTREATVSAGLPELTVTRGVSAPLSVTEALTREMTLTRPVTGELSKPDATVTREISREITVTSLASISMVVTYYPWWTRGSDSTLHIQYYKVTGEDFDDWEEIDHTPGQALTISVISSPTGDSFTPTSVDTSGWVGGYKALTAHFYGGSGSGTQTIRLSDPQLGLSLDIDITLNATQSTRNPDQCYRFYGADTAHAASQGYQWPYPDGYNCYEPDDWDAEAAAQWDQMQNDIRSNFNGDTAPGSSTASGLVAQHYLWDKFNYLWAQGHLYGGYVRIHISDTDKQNLLATHLRVTPRCYIYSWSWPGVGWTREFSKYRNRYRLKAKFTEDVSALTSGAVLSGMTPDIDVSFSEIVQMVQERGGAWDSNTDVFIPFPKSIIEAMSGNDLYVWVYIAQALNCPYTYPYFKSTMGTGPYGYITSGQQYVQVANVRVELTK